MHQDRQTSELKDARRLQADWEQGMVGRQLDLGVPAIQFASPSQSTFTALTIAGLTAGLGADAELFP